MNLEVINLYDQQVTPYKEDYINHEAKKKVQWHSTRADKETRYHLFQTHKKETLVDKERWSIELIKLGLRRVKKPVVSCSFGIDSMLTLYLTRKALVELGRDPSDIEVVWCDTLNEFPDVRKYQQWITEAWNLNLKIMKPKKVLKKIIDENGGVTSDYFFSRKGSRKNGRPLSEKCCGTLKHEPMKRAIRENNWDYVINGLRGDESSQRLRAGLRDGEFFYSIAEWKALVCRPILWWLEDDVWAYVEQEQVPYNSLYENNLIQQYPKNLDEIIHKNKEEIIKEEIDIDQLAESQLQTVTRRQANLLRKLGFKTFNPRTGCMMCPIPVKYGYLQFMRIYYPKVYDAMIYSLGYGETLMGMIPKEVKEEIEYLLGIELTLDNIHIYMKDILNAKPCTFDRF